MRIAFAGASGTGKTTLAKHFAAIYNLPINPVGCRYVLDKMGYKSAYESDADGKRVEFQEMLVNEKTEWENNHESFITDRTTVDNLVYSSLHSIYDISEEYYNKTMDHLKVYDLIFYCPVDTFIDVEDDITRLDNPVYQKLYDKMLSGILKSYNSESYKSCGTLGRFGVGGPVRDLTHKDLYERIKWVEEDIQELIEYDAYLLKSKTLELLDNIKYK